MILLVTGGAGFIGSNFIRHVIDRPEVERLINLDGLKYAGHLANNADVAAHPKYVFENVDLRDKKGVSETVARHGITHVCHLAAESHVDRSISGPDAFIHTNVLGTFHLLEACRERWVGRTTDARAVTIGQGVAATGSGRSAGGSLFLQVSTDEVFGSLGPAGIFTETTPYAPNSPYSASKAAADMLARAYHHTYGLPVIVTRCSNNYGPYQYPEKLIPVVIQSVLNRRPIPVYGDGMNVRDWLFVRDHAEALWRVLTRAKVGETYNIGGNNEWPNLRIVERICDLCDDLAPERCGNSRKLISFVPDRPGHDRRYAMDSGKIARELGWTPAHSFETGIRETVQWYLANQNWVRTVVANTGNGPSMTGPGPGEEVR